MSEINLGIGSPIKSFIEKVKQESIDGLGDWELKAPIELELNAIVNGKVGGGMDIQVVNFGAKVEAEQQQKIRLSICPKDPVSEAQKKAKIEKALAEEAKSKLDKQTNIAELLDSQEYFEKKAQEHKQRLLEKNH